MKCCLVPRSSSGVLRPVISSSSVNCVSLGEVPDLLSFSSDGILANLLPVVNNDSGMHPGNGSLFTQTALPLHGPQFPSMLSVKIRLFSRCHGCIAAA